MMTTEFVAVPADLTAGATIERLRELEPDAETIYYVYVVDADGRLVGVLSLRDLIVAQPTTPIGEVMIEEPVAVDVLADRDEVAGVVARYNLLAVPGRRRRHGGSSASSPSTTPSTRSCRPAGGGAGRTPGRGARAGPMRFWRLAACARARARSAARRRPAPARAVPRPARAGRVPRGHGPGPHRRDRRQRRRRHHDLQRHGRRRPA